MSTDAEACKHTVTIGRDGEKGLWCTDCDAKVYEVETRKCEDCASFWETIFYAGCRHNMMRVLPDMHVTYKIKDGSCWTAKPVTDN